MSGARMDYNTVASGVNAIVNPPPPALKIMSERQRRMANY